MEQQQDHKTTTTDDNGWVSISVEGGTVWRMPMLALQASNVLYRMAVSPMREGLSKTIVLTKEDSAHSLEIFCKLAVIWMMDPSVFPRSSVVRVRNLRREEMADLIHFLDKYDACQELWSAVQRCIESYPDDEYLAHKVSDFEAMRPSVVWGNNTIHRLARDKNLCLYCNFFSLQTTRRVLLSRCTST
jgi:hypothetical protein